MLGTDRFEKRFVAPKGSKFVIRADVTGLYYITMENGGVKPDFTQEKFTSLKGAERELKKFFDNNPVPVDKNSRIVKKDD